MLLVHVVLCGPPPSPRFSNPILRKPSPALPPAFPHRSPRVLSMDCHKIGALSITTVALCIVILVVMLYIACCTVVCCLLHCCIIAYCIVAHAASCTAVFAVAPLYCLLLCFLLLPCTIVQACCPFLFLSTVQL